MNWSRVRADAPIPAAHEGFDVMVLDGGSRQSLAFIRSLGRLGLQVIAAECFAECDSRLPVLSFRSRYAAASCVLTSYAVDVAAFGREVCDTAQRHGVRMVVPASDGSIAALLPVRDELELAGTRLALASTDAVRAANDKSVTLAIAAQLGIKVPRTVRLGSADGVERAMATMRFPFVLKPCESWGARSVNRLQAVDVADAEEVATVVRRFALSGTGCLAQEMISGSREGVTIFMVGDEAVAAFAHHEIRTTPALGGAAVLRESISLPPDTYSMSLKLLRTIGLQGLSEVEFRRDEAGVPYLMEINARPPGVLELAVASGVDFPRLVWERCMGKAEFATSTYRDHIRMRWLRGDMRWLRDNAGRRGRVDSLSPTRATLQFASEFFRGSRHDCFDIDDIGPWVAELVTTADSVRIGWQATAGPFVRSVEGSDAY